MKKTRSILSILIVLVMAFVISAQTVSAAVAIPKISSSKPIICWTLKSSGKVYAYKASDLKIKTGGYIACSTDQCEIIQIKGNAIQVKYPVKNGKKTAWFARSEFTSCNIANGALSKFTQNEKITTYKRSDGKSTFGSISKGDICYKLATSGNFTQVIYPVSSGYKMGWIKTTPPPTSETYYVIAKSGLNLRKSKSTNSESLIVMPYAAEIKVYSISDGWANATYSGKTGWCSSQYISKTKPVPDPVPIPDPKPTSLLFPLKGSIITSSTLKTQGQYCDYKASAGTPIYAPTDGTVKFIQTYAISTGKLASYANNFEFVSSDKKYWVKGAHLSSFNNVKLKITKSMSYPCSASKIKCTNITLATRTVKQGDLIGYVGSTGNASAPHLHLEVAENNKNGKRLNPKTVFTKW